MHVRQTSKNIDAWKQDCPIESLETHRENVMLRFIEIVMKNESKY